tara:strand:- start:2408 stop:3136 length:729 start_codon:yes stop_codon:yes gene_type:complete
MILKLSKLKNKYENYKRSNFNESKIRLLERFRKNKINLKLKAGDKVLVFGTLNYFAGVEALGKVKIEAIDICERPKFLPKNIKYKKIIKQKFPYSDNYFKFVFVNGILSHLPNTKHYLNEIYRVLNTKGTSWISVYGSSNLETLRGQIAKKLNKFDLIKIRKLLIYHNWDAGKINFILDLLNKNDNYTFKKKQIEKLILETGFKKFKFCQRGYRADLNEQIYKNKNLKKIFGNGDLRYLIYK